MSLECRVRFQSAGFSYIPHTPVLENIDLDLDCRGITMLVGKSGCGKTTLLRLMQGLLKPRIGTVVRTPGLVTSYIPQSLGLVRNLTAFENVVTGALGRMGTLPSLLKLFPSQISREARELLERFGLKSKIGEEIHHLSGGERQRVAIARALMRRPKLILADEFVSQLDAVTSAKMLEMARDSSERDTGWVITTHDLDVACAYGDRVIALRDGRIVSDRMRGETHPAELLAAIQ
jgi:phosphonate transport system ATP-binding protein